MTCRPPVDYANPRDLAQVAEPLRSRLWTAINDSPNGGLILVSGKRTDWQQYLLRQSHGCKGRECDRGCKGTPTTAVPGRSNHRNLGGSVAAADMGGIDLDWLGRHEADYGLHRPVPGEKWHFEVAGPAKVKIHAYGTTPNANDGRSWVPIYPGDTDGIRGSVYKRGGYDNEVAEIQIRLSKLAKAWKIKALHPGAIDGIFGPGTGAAVALFKQQIIKLQKLTGQATWPNTDTKVGRQTIDMLRWWTA